MPSPRSRSKPNSAKPKSRPNSSKPKYKRKNEARSAKDEQHRNMLLLDYKKFDLNGDGVMEKIELKTVLQLLDPDTWTEEAVDRLFLAFDKDGDGTTTFEEFVDWVTDSKGSDHDQFTDTIAKEKENLVTINREHAQKQLQCIKGIDVALAVRDIADRELEAIARVSDPPEIIIRLFNLVVLLLEPSVSRAYGREINYDAPNWSGIQHLMQDASFLQRICHFDAREEELQKTHTKVALHAIDMYLCFHEPSESDTEPLSFESLLKASRTHFGRSHGNAGPIIILYMWCLALLEPGLRLLAKDKFREQVVAAALAEMEEKKMQKETPLVGDAMKNDTLSLLQDVDDLLAGL